MTTRETAVRGGIWSVLQSLGGQVLGIVFFLALAYLLVPADFGIVAFAGVVVALGEIVLDLGLTEALVQESELTDAHRDSAFWVLVGVGVGLFGLTALGAELVPFPGMSGPLSAVVQVMALSFLFVNTAAVFRAELKKGMAFRSLALCSLMAVVVAGVVGVTLAWYGFGVWSLVAREVVYDFVEMVGLVTASDWSPGVDWSRDRLGDLLDFGKGMMGTRVAGFLRHQADDFIIGLTLGSTALGLYSMAYRLFLALRRLLHRSINEVSFAAFSSVQEEAKQVAEGYFSTVKTACLLAVPAFVAVAMFRGEIITLLFPERWAPATALLGILALTGAVNSLSIGVDSVLLAMGRSWTKMGMNLANAGLNIVGYLAGLPWGIEGVALGFLISQAVYQLLPLGLIGRVLDMNWGRWFRETTRPLLALAVAVGILWAPVWSWVSMEGRLFLGGCLYVFVYVACLWWIDREGYETLKSLAGTLV
jgi:O-antigen/teichoic acid export membrane protein